MIGLYLHIITNGYSMAALALIVSTMLTISFAVVLTLFDIVERMDDL